MDPPQIKESDFKSKDLKDAEREFENVQMAQEQHKIFNDFVELFLKYVPMNKISAKGIGWRSVSEWQIQHKRELQELIHRDPQERINCIDELLQIVKKNLIAMLKDEAQIPSIEKAMKETMQFYKDTYAYR